MTKEVIIIKICMQAPAVLLIFDSVQNVQRILYPTLWHCNRTLQSSDILGHSHSYPRMYVALSLDISETDRWKHLPGELEWYASCLAGSQLCLPLVPKIKAMCCLRRLGNLGMKTGDA